MVNECVSLKQLKFYLVEDYADSQLVKEYIFVVLYFVFVIFKTDISYSYNIVTCPYFNLLLLYLNQREEQQLVIETEKYFRLRSSSGLPLAIIKYVQEES